MGRKISAGSSDPLKSRGEYSGMGIPQRPSSCQFFQYILGQALEVDTFSRSTFPDVHDRTNLKTDIKWDLVLGHLHHSMSNYHNNTAISYSRKVQ